MQVKSTAKYLRISPQKARLVTDLVRGQKAIVAIDSLRFTDKKAADFIKNGIKSALANAENNYGLDRDNMFIYSITADEGPVFKRYRPRARGSSDVIRKKTTHITIVLDEIEKGRKRKAVEKQTPQVIKAGAEKAKEEAAPLSPEELSKAPKTEVEQEPKEEKEAISKTKAEKPAQTDASLDESKRVSQGEEAEKEIIQKPVAQRAKQDQKKGFFKKLFGKRFFRRKGI